MTLQELVAWIWWLSVVSTLFYVVFFAVGPGSIPWMITAELFSQGPRPAAMSVAVLVNWSANFFVGIGFPTMQTTLENYTFLPFSVFLALFWVFTYRKVPETKNKTFDEIATLFRIGHKQRLLMNNVNSISQMNSVVCEHSSLMGHEAKKGQIMGPEKGPDGKIVQHCFPFVLCSPSTFHYSRQQRISFTTAQRQLSNLTTITFAAEYSLQFSIVRVFEWTSREIDVARGRRSIGRVSLREVFVDLATSWRSASA